MVKWFFVFFLSWNTAAAADDWSGFFLHSVGTYRTGDVQLSFTSPNGFSEEYDSAVLSDLFDNIDIEQIDLSLVPGSTVDLFDFTYHGTMRGVRSGYNWQHGRIVTGVFAEVQFGNVSGSQQFSYEGNGVSARLTFDRAVALGFKLGHTIGKKQRGLLYASVGLSGVRGEVGGCVWSPEQRACGSVEGYGLSLPDVTIGWQQRLWQNGWVELSYTHHSPYVFDKSIHNQLATFKARDDQLTFGLRLQF